MKKVIIIGGGISGMTAGIYLQKAGFATEIYEKNPLPGGECTGWKRDGVYIDNCFHWLTDSREDTALGQLWREIGLLGGDVKTYEKEKFFSYRKGDKEVTLWRDPERTRKEMLELAPEDADNINKFIDNVKKAESMHVPAEKPMDKWGIGDYIKMGAAMKDMPSVMKAYENMNVADLAASFSNPVIRGAMQQMVPSYYAAFSFIVPYATVTSGNGDIPLGGSLAAALRIAERYKSLGGEIRTGKSVKSVILSGNKAKGIELENGEKIDADYVICATDADHIFSRLLPAEYMPDSLKAEFDGEKQDKYRVFSGFHCAFVGDGKHNIPSGSCFFDCDEMTVGVSTVNTIGVNCYDYDPSMAPEGKSVIQVQISQMKEDAAFWSELRKDKEKYDQQKKACADMIMAGIIKQFPEVDGHIKLLDTWTPATYMRWCNAHNGSYMAFVADKSEKSVTTAGIVKGIDNVFLAGQWLMSPGGLPCAATMGKFAAWRIAKKEGIKL